MALGLILLLYPMAIFEIQYSFQLVSANPRFYLVQPTPHSNSYYLLVAIAKIPKLCKQTSLDIYFAICKSQDCGTNRQCQSGTFF